MNSFKLSRTLSITGRIPLFGASLLGALLFCVACDKSNDSQDSSGSNTTSDGSPRDDESTQEGSTEAENQEERTKALCKFACSGDFISCERPIFGTKNPSECSELCNSKLAKALENSEKNTGSCKEGSLALLECGKELTCREFGQLVDQLTKDDEYPNLQLCSQEQLAREEACEGPPEFSGEVRVHGKTWKSFHGVVLPNDGDAYIDFVIVENEVTCETEVTSISSRISFGGAKKVGLWTGKRVRFHTENDDPTSVLAERMQISEITDTHFKGSLITSSTSQNAFEAEFSLLNCLK